MAKLAAYRAKRDFKATPEPPGLEGGSDGFGFVIQKHAASRLHYDLRLELDGVMKSWAVAKGPSLVPGDKRLAVHVEDHPVEYNSFEGTIPKGQYGGGTVQIWDRGHWVPKGDPRRAYAKGHLDFRLEGEKLGGAWHLVRLRQRPGEKQEAWLLIKSDDEAARRAGDPDILVEAPLSVVSGRSLEEIASDPNGAVWQSNRDAPSDKAEERPRTTSRPKAKAKTAAESADTRQIGPPSPDLRSLTKRGRKGPLPRSIEPSLAATAAIMPKGEAWLHEIKWDGYRLLAFKDGDSVRLDTRRGHDWTARFPSIAAAVRAIPVSTLVLDGEAVIADENGRASFSALQAALGDFGGKVATDALLYAFDLLYVEGHDLRHLPLEERKARLAALVPASSSGFLRLGEHLDGDGDAIMRSVCALGLEGVISKRRDQPYRSGRTECWLKVKCTDRQDFVVAGFVPSTASRKAVGSLVLAYYDHGRLTLAGRSGTGYTAAVARDLWTRLERLKRRDAPLAAKPNADERRGVVWTEPELVAEIEFRGWTGDDRLRHAAFKGLREDKSPTDVVRELSAPSASHSGQSRRPAGLASSRGKRPPAGGAERVKLTHPDRVLWPDVGLTKQGLAEFYEEIADWLLPHVANRPLSLVRCPEGAGSACFYQKHAWAGLSEHVLRHPIRDDDGSEEEVLYVRDLPGVLALVQASVLEIHPWGAMISDVDRPDRIVMDLDPGEDVSFADVAAGARELRERLSQDGLESFLKTTGGKGLHVVVPLGGATDWSRVKAYAKDLADGMERDSPRRYIAKASKTARRGLIYVDYLRNGRGATAIAAYSTRARAGATVSVPLRWDELTPDTKPNSWTVETLPNRLSRLIADPWAEIKKLRQGLPSPGRGASGKRSRLSSVR